MKAFISGYLSILQNCKLNFCINIHIKLQNALKYHKYLVCNTIGETICSERYQNGASSVQNLCYTIVWVYPIKPVTANLYTRH